MPGRAAAESALKTHAASSPAPLGGAPIFVSASIPDPHRWIGDFDADEITAAVLALTRELLAADARIVTMAHPSADPLLALAAADLPSGAGDRIVIYQSNLLEDALPPALREFRDRGLGRIAWTEAVAGEEPLPGRWERSLDVARRELLATEPIAAVFVGGMRGSSTEWDLFHELYPFRPRYALGPPGGEAGSLKAPEIGEALAKELADGDDYPEVWRAVLEDLRARLRDGSLMRV